MRSNKLQEIKNRYGIIGNSPLLNQAIEKAIKVAPTNLNVLINGESGVGKEVFSKIIHNLGIRKHNGFIAINCAAIPSGTIDSELFGHEKGSFTSAYDTRKGYFETVNNGTIFLDEISEMPLETQARLLRVLETGEFFKVGSSKVQKTDVRVVAASNKNLLELVEKEKFREDLFYRLTTILIELPTLRQRKDDIYLLTVKFANDIADKYKIPPLELSPDAIELLKSAYWKGNIRQLKNFIEQISVLETDRYLDANKIRQYMPKENQNKIVKKGYFDKSKDENSFSERELLYKFLFDIKKDIAELKNLLLENNDNPTNQNLFDNATKYLNKPEATINNFERNIKAENPLEKEISYTDLKEEKNLSLQDKEKEMIIEALKKYNGKRKIAAKELGISERTLYRKIKEYDLLDL